MIYSKDEIEALELDIGNGTGKESHLSVYRAADIANLFWCKTCDFFVECESNIRTNTYS